MYIGEEKIDDFTLFCNDFGLSVKSIIDHSNDNEFKIKKQDLWVEVQYINDTEMHFYIDRVEPNRHSVSELQFYVNLNPDTQNASYYISNNLNAPENITELKELFLSYF